MYFLSSTFALLAAVGVRALQSPHERAAKFSKRSFTPLYTRDATKSNPTTLFLNEKTKSTVLPAFNKKYDLTSFQSLPSMGPRCLMLTSILESHMQASSLSVQTRAMRINFGFGSFPLRTHMQRRRLGFG
jgi:hypothetical protein